jgi:hypothetical protein
MKQLDYAAQLAAMQRAILNGDEKAGLQWFLPRPQLDGAGQLRVYINNYRYGLLKVLREHYPTARALMGTKDFDTLARRYITTHPSQHFNIERYSIPFAVWSAGQGIDPVAHDLLTLESAMLDAYLAPDSPVYQPTDAPVDFAQQRFVPRKSLRLLSLNHPVSPLIDRYRDDQPLTAPQPAPHYVAVLRHHHQLQRHILEPAEHRLLSELIHGKALEAALDALLTEHPDTTTLQQKLPRWMQRWIEGGFFSA